MCVIIHQPEGTHLSKEVAQAAWETNPDGGGFAFIDDDGDISGFKSMDFGPFWKAFETSRSKFPSRDYLLHMRIGTHGTLDISNVHPFPVGGKQTVMAHNGIIHAMPKHATLSDTRMFVRDVLPEMEPGWLDKYWIKDMMEEWMGWSKLAFLTVDPAFEKNVYILNEHKGEEIDGMWFSNNNHVPKPTYSYKGKGRKPSDTSDRVKSSWGIDEDDNWVKDPNGYSWSYRPDHSKTAGKSGATLQAEWEEQLDMETYASIALSEAERAVVADDDNVIHLPIREEKDPFRLSDKYDSDEVYELLDSVREDDGLVMKMTWDANQRTFDCWGCDEYVEIDTGECQCWNKMCLDCVRIAGYCKCPPGYSSQLKDWDDMSEAERDLCVQEGV